MLIARRDRDATEGGLAARAPGGALIRRPPPSPDRVDAMDGEERDGSVLFGARVGYTHALGDLAGARVGLDGWWPFRLGGAGFGVGVSAAYGQATREVADGAGVLRSTSRAEFVPLTVRLGCELARRGRASLVAGLGATATLARFTTTLGSSAS